jgi:CRISPR-associated protein Cas1
VIKKTVEISAQPAHVSVRHRQLTLERDGETVGSLPCEDLGMVLVDHPGTTYTHAAFNALLDSDAAVIICGQNHLPQGLLLPFSDHTQVVSRLHDQIETSKPMKKRLWQQIVKAKILAQADNLDDSSAEYRKLKTLAREVRSSDAGNREAQASKIYWSVWLDPPKGADNVSAERFRRQRDGVVPNNLLNYGYAVLRAAVARSLVSSGLHPALGIHHYNRSNPFCLADDLMEPFRPLVDRVVRELYWNDDTELDRISKTALLEVLTEKVEFEGQSGPFMVQLHSLTASLARCLGGEQQQLEIPRACSSADTVSCG